MKKSGLYLKIVKLLGADGILLLISVILAVLSSVCTLFIPILVGGAIDNIIGEGKVEFSEIKIYIYKILIAVLISAAATFVMNIINNILSLKTSARLRVSAFERLNFVPISYLDKHKSGDIVSRIIADSEQFSDGLLIGLTQLVSGVTTIIGTLVFMVKINIVLALAVVAFTPIPFFIAKFISGKTFNMFKKQSASRGAETAFAEEMISNQKLIKAFRKESDSVKEFEKLNSRLYEDTKSATFFSSLVNPTTRFVNSLVYAIITAIGAVFSIMKKITVGELTGFLSYANQFTKPFNELSSVITELQNALASASRLIELTELESETDNNKKTIEKVSGKVVLKDVCFSYIKTKKLIENLNLTVEPGCRVAIVGPTGCGKTTLINLLMRFYEPDSGKIAIDGVSIKELSRKSSRQSFGMVLQDTWIKTASVRENIAFGKPDATDDEIISAAKNAYCDAFIEQLPNGYDTVISDDTTLLSAGQKQLICIARVMLCESPMLILDEATSSIDTITEVKVHKAFLKLMGDKTSFVVAHRLSTIRDSDIILVMNKGKVVESGNHQELMEKRGFYFELYNSEFSKSF